MTITDKVGKFVGNIVDVSIPDSLIHIFDKIGDFLQGAEIMFLNAYVIILVILFFAILVGLIYLPIKLYPMYKEYSGLIEKILKIDKF